MHPSAARRPIADSSVSRRAGRFRAAFAACSLLIALAAGAPAPAAAELADFASAVASVVRVNASALEDARSSAQFGTQREGSGVVIDGSGLVLTAGYLIVEAESIVLTLADGSKIPAAPVAHDQASGFGIVRAAQPLPVKPATLGTSARLSPKDAVLAVSWGGPSMALPAVVADRRTFVANWEYMMENAIFTVPAHPATNGAALFTPDAKLVGIGLLTVANGIDPGQPVQINMFVPVDGLKPILADLLENGQRAGPQRPWLGVLSEEIHGRLIVTEVAKGSPAATAGIKPGDLVLGIDGEPVSSLDAFYRLLWSYGEAGTTVPLDLLKGMDVVRVAVASIAFDESLRRAHGF